MKRKRMSMKKFFSIIMLLAMAAMLMGNDGGCDGSQAQKQARAKIENTESLMSKQPTPKIEFSMDRYLTAQRLIRFNDPNKMSYLYVVLLDGTWIQTTIIGKLTSTTKRLTSPENTTNIGYGNQAPDEMGTWGSSDPAKIGMTTLGSLIEFGGFSSYIYSEVPLIFKNLDKKVIEVEVNLTTEEKAQLLGELNNLKKQAKGGI